MNQLCWWLVDVFSRALKADEREAVRGDLAECSGTSGRALLDLLGLVARQQASMWMAWRPWIVLVGLVFPFGILLSLYSRLTADGSAITLWLYFNNWDWALLENPGFRHDFPRFLAVVLGNYLWLVCLSWIGGVVLGALTRGTIAINGTLLCLVLVFGEFVGVPRLLGYWAFLHRARDFDPNAAVFAVKFYRVILPPTVQVVLVLLPAIWGMNQGRRLPIWNRWQGNTDQLLEEKKMYEANPTWK